jgi:hypothetical protein
MDARRTVAVRQYPPTEPAIGPPLVTVVGLLQGCAGLARNGAGVNGKRSHVSISNPALDPAGRVTRQVTAPGDVGPKGRIGEPLKT